MVKFNAGKPTEFRSRDLSLEIGFYPGQLSFLVIKHPGNVFRIFIILICRIVIGFITIESIKIE